MTSTAPHDDEDIGGLDIVDRAHLASFTDGDTELEGELAELFVSTAQGYLKRMREAVQEERGWSAEAHALKGASANLGARRVAALARQAEFLPPSDERLEALGEAVDEVAAHFANRRA